MIREKMLGPEHPDTAESLNNLAMLYCDQKKYAEAEPLLQRALAIREKMLEIEHPTPQRALTIWQCSTTIRGSMSKPRCSYNILSWLKARIAGKY